MKYITQPTCNAVTKEKLMRNLICERKNMNSLVQLVAKNINNGHRTRVGILELFNAFHSANERMYETTLQLSLKWKHKMITEPHI